MATQNINIGVNVSDNGTAKKVVKNFEEITQAATQAQRAAQNINAAGGTAGSRGVAAKAAPSGSQNMMTGQEYGSARGSAGLTGASARDFAAQSQGLGGLVRLYATYAANLFAVSAAFNALKTAMDTTNMIKGMDQLGAISGVAIGTMAKNLVAATDGALSLREAAQATTKIISSGIDSSAVEKIGKVAKGASQALGVDLQDAVSRLTRGITKLEPELLDELGIFVKIDDVVAKYAQSVGKSASALTDFERRQAFANAVLEQGNKKFGDLKLETNPYDKLLASVKDLGQKVLEVVNVAFVPLLNALSSSPMALGAVLASLSLMLVKQALPAIGQFREGLQQAEQAAADFSVKKAKDAEAARAKHYDNLTKQVEAQADLQIEITDRAAKKEEEIAARKKQKAGSASLALLDTAPQLRTKEMYAAAQAEVSTIEQQIKNTDKRTKAGKELVANLMEEKAAKLDSIAVSHAQQKVEESLATKIKSRTDELAKVPGAASAAGIANINAARAEAAANRSRIISNAGVTGSLVGVTAAMREVKAEFAAKNQSMWSAPFTVISSGAAAVTGRLSGLLGTLNPYIMAVQIAIAVGAGLNAMFSKNSEQSAKFSTSLDALNKATKTAGDNAAYFAKQDWAGSLPLAIITSRATAFKELSGSLTKVAEDFDKVVSKRNAWDSFTNALFAVTPLAKSDKQAVAKEFSSGITESIKLIPTGPLRKEYEEKVKKILGINRALSQESISLRIRTMGEDEAVDALKKVAVAQEELAMKQKVAAQAAAEVDTAFKDTVVAYQELSNSLSSSTPLEKFAANLLTISAKLTDALKEPETAFASLTKLLTEPKQMALLGPKSFSMLQASKDEVIAISKEIKNLEAQQQKLNKEKEGMPEIGSVYNQQVLKEIQAEIDRGDKKLVELRAAGAKITADIYNAVNVENFKTAGKVLAAEMNAASQQSALTVRKAYSSLFTGQAAINEQTDIAKKDLDIKKSLVSITADLIKSNYLIINSNKDKMLEDAKTAATKESTNPAATVESVKAAEKTLSTYEADKSAITKERQVLTSSNPRATAGKIYDKAELSQALQSLQPFLNAIEGAKKQLVMIDAQGKAIDLEKELKTQQESTRLAIIQKNYEVQRNELALKRRDIFDQLVGKADEQTVGQRIVLENQLELNKQKAKEMELEGKIQTTKSVMAKPEFAKQTDEFKKNTETQLAQDETSLRDIIDASKREKAIKEESDKLRLIDVVYKAELERLDKVAQTEKVNADARQSSNAIAKAAREQELNNLVALNAITERTRITRQRDIDLISVENDKTQRTLELNIEKYKELDQIKARKTFIESFSNKEIDAEKPKLKALELQSKEISDQLDRTKELIGEQGEQQYLLEVKAELEAKLNSSLSQRQALQAIILSFEKEKIQGLDYQNQEEARLNTSYTLRQGIINANAIAQEDQITKAASLASIIDRQNEKLADQNTYLETAKNLGESLNATFSLFGESMSKAGEGLASLVTGFADARVAAEKYADDRVKAEQRLGEARADQDPEAVAKAKKDLDKLDADNAKNEMKRDAQAIGNTKKIFKEKTAAYKILSAVEKAMHLAKLAMDIKEMFFDTAKTATSVPNSLARAGAAGLEAVTKAFTLPPPMGFVAGAAMTGIIAALLGSAFKGGGGKSAPAFSMNSEQIQETQGTGTTYNSKGEKVADIGGILGDDSAKANSVVKSLEILKNNSFESLDYDNKLLRSFENVALAIGKATNTVLTSGLRSVNPELAASLGSKTMGGSDIPVIGKLISSIFGGSRSETRNITSQRLELSGTFGAVADDIGSGLRQITDVLVTWTKKGGWFSKDKSGSYVQQLVGTVPEDINDAFRDIFQSFKEGYQDIAEMMGMGNNNALTFVTDKLQTVELKDGQGNPLKFDYTGLKGEEVKTELEAYFSKINNIALKALFPEFSAFETAGEDYGTTVVRVLQNTKQVELALISIGNASSAAMRGLAGFSAADALLEASGGLEAFVDNTKFFASNFLTEAERLVPVQAAVTQQMKDLGYGSITTREQFKQLIQTFDLTDPAVYETYAALMTVQKGFFEVTAAAQKEADERIGLAKKLDQLGKTQAELREQELENLFAGNRELQREIWLKEDQIAAAKALQSSLKGVTDSIKSQITSLKDYKTSLLSGANSTLTASQQYRNAKTEIDDLVTVITKTAITPEEIDARNKALGKFSGASDKFLGKSRELFASGAQYSTDFNTVMSIIDTVGSSLETQLTDAEKQLGALETSNTYLESISTASKSTAELLQTYLGLGGQPITGSSFAAGTNYVPQDMIAQIHKGERIIPAADNAELMMNMGNRNRTNEVLITEIKKLNEKISSLERTVAEGAVINADATNRNTEQIAQAVVDSSGKTIQASRLQSKASIK